MENGALANFLGERATPIMLRPGTGGSSLAALLYRRWQLEQVHPSQFLWLKGRRHLLSRNDFNC